MPLLELHGSKSGIGHWTIRHAVEGVQIFGGIGSGKTSGSGRMLALKYLNAGFGGLVLTVKPDEKELWENYCALTGRADDLIIVEPDRTNYFNFLDYESKSGERKSGGMTENIVQVLKTVIRASEEKASGSSDDPFWETALDMLIFNTIDLCKLAYGQVTVQRMFDIVQALPTSGGYNPDALPQDPFQEAFHLAQTNVMARVNEWESSQTFELNT